MKDITIIDNKHISLLNDSMRFLSKNTQRAYKSDLHTFLDIVKKEIQKTTMKDLHYYFSELENRNYRNSTINRKINSLSKIFTIYEKAGIIKENLIRQIKEIKKITRETDKIVIQNLNKDDITEVINHATKKTALIIKTLTNTGLRISELANIKNSDIENYDGFKKIRIVGKGKKERFIFISTELYCEIKKVFNKDCDYLFHSKSCRKLTRQILYKQINNAFCKHTGKKGHPHSLRHFFATYKIGKEKKDVKAVSLYLGHSTTSITLSMYVNTALKPEETVIIN